MKQKNQNGRLKKTEIFNSTNSQYNFVNISGIDVIPSGVGEGTV
jgi:hypothetical protein